jgi:hypothetical protein
MFCRLTCHFILQISDQNSLTGTMPTEIGMMASLTLFKLCKLSSIAFRGLRACWDFLPYTCHFILQISVGNSLTGTLPTEIGMMNSLTELSIRKLSSFVVRGIRPCAGTSCLILVILFFKFQGQTPSLEPCPPRLETWAAW